MTRLALFVCTFGYVGYAPFASGTAGSAAGLALYAVLVAAGRMDLSGVARVGRRHQDVTVVQGQGIIGIRVPAPPDVQVSARADDNAWTFTLAARATAPAAAQLTREVNPDGRARMNVRFGREGVVGRAT